MALILAQNWWMFVLRGIAAILFGVLAMLWPGSALAALVLLFGAYLLVDGVFTAIAALRNQGQRERWWVLLLEGLAGIAAGVLTFVWPNITELVLLALIAAWAIVTGILEIAAAIRLRKEIEGEWLLGLSGAASALFGLLIVFQPAAGALAVIWIIAAYAIAFGILLVALGLRLRSWRDAKGRSGEVPGATLRRTS